MREQNDYFIEEDVYLGDHLKEIPEVVCHHLVNDKQSDRFYQMTKINWAEAKLRNHHTKILQDHLITQ